MIPMEQAAFETWRDRVASETREWEDLTAEEQKAWGAVVAMVMGDDE